MVMSGYAPAAAGEEEADASVATTWERAGRRARHAAAAAAVRPRRAPDAGPASEAGLKSEAKKADKRRGGRFSRRRGSAARTLVDRLREVLEQLVARGSVDPVALALVLVQEMEAIAPRLSIELRAALDRVRLPLADAAAGRDPQARLAEAQSELESLIRELEAAAGRAGGEAFWK
jgi:hypothetical protein